MEGWIKIHRQIKDHWLWKSERRLKWWFDILLTVNHSDSKILIKGNLIECKRGQSVRSLETWAKDWNVTKGAVRDFFKLLESDQMLYTESLHITTRITVCKYEDYQTEQYAEKTHRKRKTNAEETQGVHKQEGEEEIKNDNNEKTEIDNKWNLWKEFKKAEFNFSYKSEISEQAAKNELINLSGNNAEIAIKIIEQSIAKGWKGFFKLNNNGNGTDKKNIGASNEAIARIISKKFGADSGQR